MYLLQGWRGRALLGVAVRLPSDAILALEVGYRFEQLGCVQIAPSDQRAPGWMDGNHLDKRLLRRPPPKKKGEKKGKKKQPTSKRGVLRASGWINQPVLAQQAEWRQLYTTSTKQAVNAGIVNKYPK